MTIFNQMKSNSEFKNMLRGTAEQINKVMKNEWINLFYITVLPIFIYSQINK